MSACSIWWNRAFRWSAPAVQVLIDPGLVTRAPKVHQLVHLVDQRYGPTDRPFQAEVLPATSAPSLELHLCAAPGFALFLILPIVFAFLARRPIP